MKHAYDFKHYDILQKTIQQTHTTTVSIKW